MASASPGRVKTLSEESSLRVTMKSPQPELQSSQASDQWTQDLSQAGLNERLFSSEGGGKTCAPPTSFTRRLQDGLSNQRYLACSQE